MRIVSLCLLLVLIVAVAGGCGDNMKQTNRGSRERIPERSEHDRPPHRLDSIKQIAHLVFEPSLTDADGSIGVEPTNCTRSTATFTVVAPVIAGVKFVSCELVIGTAPTPTTLLLVKGTQPRVFTSDWDLSAATMGSCSLELIVRDASKWDPTKHQSPIAYQGTGSIDIERCPLPEIGGDH